MGLEFKKTNDFRQRFEECKIILKRGIIQGLNTPTQLSALWKRIVAVLFDINIDFKELVKECQVLDRGNMFAKEVMSQRNKLTTIKGVLLGH